VTAAVELTAWEHVEHVRPTAELEKLVGEPNSFSSWPPFYRAQALKSFKRGAELGHVAGDFDQSAIVGTVDYRQADTLELRARWAPASVS